MKVEQRRVPVLRLILDKSQVGGKQVTGEEFHSEAVRRKKVKEYLIALAWGLTAYGFKHVLVLPPQIKTTSPPTQ